MQPTAASSRIPRVGNARQPGPAITAGAVPSGPWFASFKQSIALSRAQLAVALFAVAALRLASGLPSFCELPYWYLSYTEGFIRRAFVGTLTGPLLLGMPRDQALLTIGMICLAANLSLLLMLGIALAKSHLKIVDPLIVLFIFSNALVWLGHDLGTLDAFIFLVSVGGFLLIYRGKQVSGLAFCAVAPLIHEGTIFLLVPLLGVVWLLRPERRQVSLCGMALAVATGLVLWRFSTTEFAWPAGMPILAEDHLDLQEFVSSQLGQGLRFFRPRIDMAVIFFSIAPCVAMALLTAYRVGWVAGACTIAAVMITWSITLIAYDTARLFAWGPIVAAVAAGLAQHQKQIASIAARSARNPSSGPAAGSLTSSMAQPVPIAKRAAAARNWQGRQR